MNPDFFDQFIKNAPVGYANQILITDNNDVPVDFEFLEANHLFGDFLGVKSELIKNRKASEIFAGNPKNPLNNLEIYIKPAQEGERREYEMYSDLLNKWYKVIIFSSKKGSFSTILSDITKEKEQLAEYENFFKVNLNLLCIADTYGNFIKVNKEWERVLGYKQEELEHRKFLDFIHPDDLQPTLEKMAQLFNQEQVTGFINRYRSKDGSYKFVEWRSQPYGTTIYAAAVDITEKMLQEQELHSQTALLAGILDSIPDLVFYKNNESVYMGCNPQFAKYAGKEKEEIIGKTDFDIFPEEIAGNFIETDQQVVMTGQTSHTERI
ncbi:MAG: PAS domain S-box protein, partial [Firmicutes bacterium]|nr:PAS domain S-box protein [Bacillota bacterium]